MSSARMRRPTAVGAVALVLLLVAGSVVVVAAAFSNVPAPRPSSHPVLAYDVTNGGPALTELFAIYSVRPDLQSAYPDAADDDASFLGLVDWAAGTVEGEWSDHSYSSLGMFGYWYVMMSLYNQRSDLQAAFPDAYDNYASFTDLVNWSASVVSGSSSDGAYFLLAPYGYWYALMSTYNGRADLETAFPQAYSNPTNFTELVGWAEGVVSGAWTDGAYASLAPFGQYYALLGVYNSRPDLQAAFPDAYSNLTNFTELVNWSNAVVNGTDVDGANTTLEPFGAWYTLMAVYNNRPDLLSEFPDAYTSFDSFLGLENWSGGTVAGEWVDGAEPILAAFGFSYLLMMIYNERPDLQAAFPDAYTNLASTQGLAAWAGAVVNGSSSDGASAVLNPFAYWYALFGLVYGERPDLQAAFPGVFTIQGSSQGLLAWADQVVRGEFSDPADATLSKWAGAYEILG